MASSTTTPDPDYNRFYLPSDPEITSQTRQILTQYSGIPEAQIITHIRNIRDKAWAVYKYPCIGLYNFLHFSIGNSPNYNTLLTRLQSGATLLDLGCCFGQDIRKLVFDGVPGENLTGSELEAEFVELGYALFCDKTKIKATFTTGDFLGPDKAGLKDDSFDFIHTAAFFHLFSWDDQVEAVSRALRLLKQKPGSMLFGRQTAVEEAGVVKIGGMGEVWRHDLASWGLLMEEVKGKTGLRFEASVEWVGERKVEVGWRMMGFNVVLE